MVSIKERRLRKFSIVQFEFDDLEMNVMAFGLVALCACFVGRDNLAFC